MDFKNPAKVDQRVQSPLKMKNNRKGNAPWLKVRRRFKTPMFKDMR